MPHKLKKDYIQQEDRGGTNPGVGFYAGQQTEKPKKVYSIWLLFFLSFFGFILGLVVGAVIN